MGYFRASYYGAAYWAANYYGATAVSGDIWIKELDAPTGIWTDISTTAASLSDGAVTRYDEDGALTLAPEDGAAFTLSDWIRIDNVSSTWTKIL